MEVQVKETPVVSINAPEWFQEKEFIEWLEKEDNCIATWHKRGMEPTEYSDTFVFVDPSLSGEGSDQCVMPDKYWGKIIEICKKYIAPASVYSDGFHIVVRITNLQE